MRHYLRKSLKMSLYVGLMIGLATVVLSAGNACAQGAAGGSLGNDNKSLSGSSEGSRSTTPARRERQEQRASPKREAAPRRREAAPRSGGGVLKFDGIWSVTSVGETCSDTLTTTATISNGRVTSANDTGTISANGVSSSVGNYSGIRVTAQGRSTATSGSGRFQRSDGCVGRWTSSKQ